jgi:hypothetical protein
MFPQHETFKFQSSRVTNSRLSRGKSKSSVEYLSKMMTLIIFLLTLCETAVSLPNLNMANLLPNQGFKITGARANDQSGYSVSGSGDYNGDGFADIVIGAISTGASYAAGTVYVVFGKAAGFGTVSLANLHPPDGFSIICEQYPVDFGIVVDSEGDINGDGYDDILVSKRGVDNNDPLAFVIFGKPDGFSDIIVDNLTPSQGFAIIGFSSLLGLDSRYSAWAGDVNNDGFSDIVIGTPAVNSYAGAAYIVFGKKSGLGNIVLSTLTPSQGIKITGAVPNDYMGRAVASAGDINNDGYDDVLIGAPGVGSNAGILYVIFGGETLTFVNVASMTKKQGLKISGCPGSTDQVGYSAVGTDINNDGYSDVIVGSPGAYSSGGQIYVFYGTIVTRNLDCHGTGIPSGKSSGMYDNSSPNLFFGRYVNAVGDINGDGFNDYIIGEYLGGSAGMAFVLYGGNTLASGVITSLSASQGFSLVGEHSNDYFGWSVSGGGDINGDGLADIVVGARAANGAAGVTYVIFGSRSGFTTSSPTRTPTIYPTTAPNNKLLLSLPFDGNANDVSGNGNNGVVHNATLTIDRFGNPNRAYRFDGQTSYIEVTNGRGLSFSNDFSISLWVNPFNSSTMYAGIFDKGHMNGNFGLYFERNGNAYNLFYAGYFYPGGSFGPGSTRFNNYVWNHFVFNKQGTSVDYYLNGQPTSHGVAPSSVVLNANNLPFIIGAQSGAPSTNPATNLVRYFYGLLDDISVYNRSLTASEVQALYNKPDPFTSVLPTISPTRKPSTAKPSQGPSKTSFVRSYIDLASLSPTQGFAINGAGGNDKAGAAVNTAGDVDGDGYDDIIMAAPYASYDSGHRGGGSGEVYVVYGGPSLSTISLSSITQSQGFLIHGATAGAALGSSVSSAGDFNKDGKVDLMVSSITADGTAGVTYIIYGNHTRRIDLDLYSFSNLLGVTIHGGNGGDNSGWSINKAGDVNGDGFDDVVIGAPYVSTTSGQSYLIYGNKSMSDISLCCTLILKFPVPLISVGGTEYLGGSVAGADINADGYSDLIVGSKAGSGTAGAVNIVWGKSTFNSLNLNSAPIPSQQLLIRGASSGDNAGFSVNCAGDVNGDGFNDIILGAPGVSASAGAAYVVFGKANYTSTIYLSSLPSSQGFSMTGTNPNDKHGYCVSGAGDLNNDGFADMIIGAPYASPSGKTSAGLVYVIFGRASLSNIVLPTIRSIQGFVIYGAAAGHNLGISLSNAGDVNKDSYDDIIIGASGANSNAGAAYVVYGNNFISVDSPTGRPTSQPSSQPSQHPSLTAANSVLNLVQNPGAEEGDTGWLGLTNNLDTGWVAYNGDAHSGARGFVTQMNTDTSVFQNISLVIGATYTLSVWIGNGGSLSLTCDAGALLGSVNGGYVKFSSAFTALHNVATVKVTGHASVGHNLQFDDVQVSVLQYPSTQPSSQPSTRPFPHPTNQPSAVPSRQPVSQPSSHPSVSPSGEPTSQPRSSPSTQPSISPSALPTEQPSNQPTSKPSAQPSAPPTVQPFGKPSTRPSSQPSIQPSNSPSSQPSARPTAQPFGKPSSQPSSPPSVQPSVGPSSQPSARPTAQPFGKPSSQPSSRPSVQPSVGPSSQPSARPTAQPFSLPSPQPSSLPSTEPSVGPSSQPSSQPTAQPLGKPSTGPSSQPSMQPHSRPSDVPSVQPTGVPSTWPSAHPSAQPKGVPSGQPSVQPFNSPTSEPSAFPSGTPTDVPSSSPTSFPSLLPSSQPTILPSVMPTSSPSSQPSSCPTKRPSIFPTASPTTVPSREPSGFPTGLPTNYPSGQPTHVPTTQPVSIPTLLPLSEPSDIPSSQPSLLPTVQPSSYPSEFPSGQPSRLPTMLPIGTPTSNPSASPTGAPVAYPTTNPSNCPTQQPVGIPSCQPSGLPSSQPSGCPSSPPTYSPSRRPTSIPSVFPNSRPSSSPTNLPSEAPSVVPTMQPSSIPISVPSAIPSTQPSSRPLSQPSRIPISEPSVLPTGQPISRPTSQPSDQPVAKPTNRPSIPPSLQPSSYPSAYPSVLPTIRAAPGKTQKPSLLRTLRPSKIPSVQPSSSPTKVSVSVLGTERGFKIIISMLGILKASESSRSDIDIVTPSLGSSFVIFGSKNVNGDISLKVPENGLFFSSTSGALNLDKAVRSASTAEFNNDGNQDIIIGDPLVSKVYLLFGNERGFIDLKTDAILFDESSNSLYGWSVDSAKDFNGDGHIDIVSSALGTGKIYIIYGPVNRNVPINTISSTEGIIITGKVGATTGICIAGIGDINGDHYDDVAVSAIYQGNSFIYIIFGSVVSGNNKRNLAALSPNQGFIVTAPLYTGFSISFLGDINVDGFDDFIVGSIPFKGASQEQISYVLYGSLHVNSSISLNQLRPSEGFRIFGGGFIVSGPGDLNNDGVNDILITNYQGWKGNIATYIIAYPVNNTSPPTLVPSLMPIYTPTSYPSVVPSILPTALPTRMFNPDPTSSPTSTQTTPSFKPSVVPSGPSIAPTAHPTGTNSPSKTPSLIPSLAPTYARTLIPSVKPSITPSCSFSPTTSTPSFFPTKKPTIKPTFNLNPTSTPSGVPTVSVHSEYHTTLIQEGGVYVAPPNKQHFIINSTVNVEIISSNAPSRYTILSSSSGTVTIIDFKEDQDVLDLSEFISLRSVSNLMYNSPPLALQLPNNQQIILPQQEDFTLTEANFLFCCQEPTTTKTNQSLVSEGMITILVVMIGLLGLSYAFFRYLTKDKFKNKSADKMHRKKMQELRKLQDKHLEEDLSFELSEEDFNETISDFTENTLVDSGVLEDDDFENENDDGYDIDDILNAFNFGDECADENSLSFRSVTQSAQTEQDVEALDEDNFHMDAEHDIYDNFVLDRSLYNEEELCPGNQDYND